MRGRTLILVGLIVFMVAVAAGALLLKGRTPEPAPEIEGTPGPTPLPQDMEEILVAAQGTIPRGTLITEESGAVTTAIWPKDSVPEGTLTEAEEVYGRYTRVDIMRGMPIIDGVLTEKPGELGAIGSDIAVQIPSGKVAYALPVARYSSVAWALKPGDYVDVLISLLIVDLDEEFQSLLPNNAACVSPPAGEECEGGVLGRLEGLPNNWVVNVIPNEPQRPRLVTQVAVQNAMVLHVGDWEEKREEPPVEEETTGGEEAPPPVESVRGDVEPVTLVVTPQDAIALKYALEVGADIDLVLRAVGDTAPVSTETVTLQYLFSRFNIEQPPKLPYGVEPRLESLLGTASEAVGSPEGGEPRE
jgi:Flp pilus assembly protein CpaB